MTMQPRRIIALIAAIAVGVMVGGLLYLVVVERSDQRTDRQLRAAAFRLCSRQNVDRAFAHTKVPSNELVVVEHRLPILDCRPNLTGGPARRLSTNEQRVFVLRYRLGRLTPTETGICNEPLEDLSKPGEC